MTAQDTAKDKQITIDVPEERVPEFYAFYGRFLAGFPGRRGHGHRCGGRHQKQPGEATATTPETGTQTA